VFVAFEATGADLEPAVVREAHPLEIRLAAFFAGRVELGGARAVGITAGQATSFLAD